MALAKRFQEELACDISLAERCEFSLKVYFDRAVYIPNKESIIIDWLIRYLNQGLSDHSEKESVDESGTNSQVYLEADKTDYVEIWKTLFVIIENESKCKGITLKKSFVKVFPSQLRQGLAVKDVERYNWIIKILILLVKSQSGKIFNHQVENLFEIVTLLLESALQLEIEEMNLAIDSIIDYLKNNQRENLMLHFDYFLSHTLKFLLLYMKQCKTNLHATLFLKEMCCHKNYIKHYEDIFTTPEISQDDQNTKPYFALFCFLQRTRLDALNVSCDSVLVEAVEEAVAMIFEGTVKKSRREKKSPYFELLVVFCRILNVDKGFPSNESKSAVTGIQPLLNICLKNKQLFSIQGDVPHALQLEWYKILVETLLVCVIPSQEKSPELLQAWIADLTALITIRQEMVDTCAHSIWKETWLEFVSEDQTITESHSEFLCQVLHTYINMRQLPRMIAKLLEQIKKTPGKIVERMENVTLPSKFRLQLSENITALPIGQTIQIWEKFVAVLNEFENSAATTVGFTMLLELFVIYLLHIRLADPSVPAQQITAVRRLMADTYKFIKRNLKHTRDASSVKLHLLLSLCYAWGEVKLAFKIFRPGIKILGSQCPEFVECPPLFNLTILHPGKSWLEKLLSKTIPSKDLLLVVPSLLLLVQKIRAIIISDNAFNEFGKAAVCETAKCIFDVIKKKTSSGDLKEEIYQGLSLVNENNFHSALNLIAIECLPLVNKFLPPKHLSFAGDLILEILFSGNEQSCSSALSLYNRTVKLLQSQVLTDSRDLQSLIITAFLWRMNILSSNLKRKLDDNGPVYENVFKNLSSKRLQWLASDFEETNDDKIWNKLQTAANNMVHWIRTDSDKSGSKLKSETLLPLIGIVNHLPLTNLKPSDQLRCVIAMFHLLTRLRKDDQVLLNEVFADVIKILVTLLEPKCESLFRLFKSRIFLKECYAIISAINLTQVNMASTYSFCDKLGYMLTSREEFKTLQNFTKNISLVDLSPLSCIHFLQVLLKVITTERSSFHTVKKPENVFHLQKIGDTISLLLTKWLDDNKKDKNADPVFVSVKIVTLKWLLEFYCSSENNKSQANSILQQNLSVVDEALSSLRDDTVSNEFSLQLIQTLCFFYNQLSETLSTDFIIRAWNSTTKNNGQESLGEFQFRDEEALKGDPTFTQKPSLNWRTLNSILKVSDKAMLKEIVDNMEKSLQIIKFDDSIKLKNLLCLYTCLFQSIFKAEPLMMQHSFQSTIRMSLVWFARSPSAFQSFNEVLLYLSDIDNACPGLFKANSIFQTLQICSMINLNHISDPETLAMICKMLLTILNNLLLKHGNFMRDCIAAYATILSNVLITIVKLGDQDAYTEYSSVTLALIFAGADLMTKIIKIMEKKANQFDKSMCCLLTDYLIKVQTVTLHPSMKDMINPILNRIIKIFNQHDIDMLSATLQQGARQIFQSLYEDYSRYYKYKVNV